ncbi:MAG: DUF58 domain-containing protein [Thermoplasmatota archaeon]
MRSHFTLYIVILAILTLFIGIVFKSWVFLVASIANLAILAVSLRGLPPKNIDVELNRASSEQDVYEDGEVTVKIELKNKGSKLKYLELIDNIPPKVEIVEGSNHHILSLEKNETKMIEYTLSCPLRGRKFIGPIKMRYRDSLGFYFEEWTVEKVMKIHVLPKTEDMNKVNVRPSYTRNWLGNIQSQSIGIGSEFYSLREYHPGDEMRKINWKATARYLNPITNEFEGEKSGDVVIVVDGYREGNVGTIRKNTTNASIRAAASLATNILTDRNRVGLIILGDTLNWIYPRSGRDQLYKILDNLSNLKEGGMWKIQDTKWLIRRFFPSRSMMIFISPLIQPKITETIIDICMKEFDVMVISPDPIEIEKSIGEEYDPGAEKLLRMERENIIDTLWPYSIVVDWDPNEPLEASLEEVIRYWKRK